MRHASAHRIPDVGPARLPVPELSIVVPTFNEAANVPLLVAALDAALRGIAWEVIFVDDDSRDGTTDAVRNIGAADARVRCIRRIGRRGLSGASIEGMLSSSAGIVATMDGDLQHDETLLPAMLAQIRSGADVVVASRFAAAASASDGLSATRLKGSQLATQLARRMLGITVSDPMSGFFMMRRPAFERVAPRLSTQGFKILMDILASASEPLKTAELPLRFRPRLHGVSKLDNLVAMEYLSLLLAKASGDRLSMRFVLFGLVGAIGVGVHLLVLKAALAGSLSFVLAQGLAASAASSISPEAASPAIPLTPVFEASEPDLRPHVAASSTLPVAVASPGSIPVTRTLEDAVADMLRPMLQQWVAENMPRIIERALRTEVAQSVKPGNKPPGT